jgi:hypothetical protein
MAPKGLLDRDVQVEDVLPAAMLTQKFTEHRPVVVREEDPFEDYVITDA